MSVHIEDQESDVVLVRVSGRVTAREWQTAQKGVSSLLKSRPKSKVSLLVDASRFDGWYDGMWGDLWFQLEHDAQIRRMAIIVDTQWQNLAMLFADRPSRKIEIRAFATLAVAAARDWLTAPPRRNRWPTIA